MNAFEDGTVIHFDVPMAKGNAFPFFPDVHGAPFDPEKAHCHMTRWTVDMGSRGNEFAGMRRLADVKGEFPRIDDRYVSRAYRYGFLLAQDFSRPLQLPGGRSATGMMMNLLARLDHATGDVQTYWAGPTSTLQEPCFVPRSPAAPEGEGYLLAVANRLAESRSDLLIFDAQHLAQGPIATVKLELRLRPALHGNWTPEQQLERTGADRLP